jgi:TatD DNase family protein
MLIDTHAHLSILKERGIDSHETLKELFASGFKGIIDISLEPDDLFGRMEEFSVYPQVYFASGLWPHSTSIANRERLVRELKQNLYMVKQGEHASKLCALGEFGLDHHWNDGEAGTADLAGERELMEMQLEAASVLKLPVIIHSRDAAKETAEILARYTLTRGVIHCFSYGKEDAKIFLDLGYYISFAGNITYKNAGNIREACKAVPVDRLLLETDCPYLAPVPYRGKPAHPGMVEEAYKTAAEIRGTSAETLAEQIAENAGKLFGITGW